MVYGHPSHNGNPPSACKSHNENFVIVPILHFFNPTNLTMARMAGRPGLVMTNSLLLKMAIEIVDFPWKMVMFHSYVKLPEGISWYMITPLRVRRENAKVCNFELLTRWGGKYLGVFRFLASWNSREKSSLTRLILDTQRTHVNFHPTWG